MVWKILRRLGIVIGYIGLLLASFVWLDAPIRAKNLTDKYARVPSTRPA
jgi:hypothetical protein